MDHINNKAISRFSCTMTLLEVAFQMIILTYIRVANADEVTYESLVEFVIILSEIIHI